MRDDLSRGDDAVQRHLLQLVVGQRQLRNVRPRLCGRNDVPGRHVRLHVPSDELQWHLLFNRERPTALRGELHGVPGPAGQRSGHLQRRRLWDELQRRLQRLQR